jgi:DNA ligase (NAD+)
MVGDKVKFITHCPECGSPLTRYEGEAAHYCTNDSSCPPQIKGKIEHFVGRKAMNIDGLGTETVDQFYQEGLIHTIADLYTLKAPDIACLERMGKKSAVNIINSTPAVFAQTRNKNLKGTLPHGVCLCYIRLLFFV